MAHGVAKKLGYETVPWYNLTWVVLAIYLGLTMFSMYFRPDFFNVRFYPNINIIVDYLCSSYIHVD